MRPQSTRMTMVLFVVCWLTLQRTPAHAQLSSNILLYAADYTIHTYDFGTNVDTKIATLNDFGSDAGWSPDGRYIYLITYEDPETRTLTLFDITEQQYRLIRARLFLNDCDLPLIWLPSSRYLAYLDTDNLINTWLARQQSQRQSDLLRRGLTLAL